MNHRINKAKRFIVRLLATSMLFLVQAPMRTFDAIQLAPENAELHAGEEASSHASAPQSAATELRVAEAYARIPLSFEPNVGQTDDSRVRFLSHGDGYNLFLTSTEAEFAFCKTQRPRPGPAKNEIPDSIYSQHQVDRNPAALRISLTGANKAAKARGVRELPGRSNYFIGSDPGKWRVNVPTYSRIEYESIYRGVDLVYYGNQGQLEYDFIVAPGASYKVIRIRFEGGDNLRLDEAGDLVIEAAGRKVYQRRPVVYQEVNGIKETIVGRYVVKGRSEVGFEIRAYDDSRPLIIDPVFSYSTYVGNGTINSVAVDQIGNTYVTGTRTLDDFNSVDAFVMKLNRAGDAVVYSTFLGGSDRIASPEIENQSFDIAVDSIGHAYVVGSTNSKDFPTTPGAVQPTSLERRSGFVTKLNSTGDALVYSTYLGGTDNFGESSVAAVAVDGAGSAYVTGKTSSFKFPVVNPVQAVNRGGFCGGGDAFFPCQLDAFVSKLNPTGSNLDYSTYLGGVGDDSSSDIAVDGAGSAYVVGTTSASGFPTLNPIQSARSGSSDVFIAKLNVVGNELIYSTLLGGAGGDSGNGIAIDLAGSAYVTGRTSSTDFPTTPNALQSANASSTAFKSTDEGATWSAINRGLPDTDSSVNQLVIDSSNSSTLYATTGGRIFKSTNGGNSWLGSFAFDSGFVATFAIDPSTPSTLYAGLSGIFGVGELQKSTDGGKNWFLAGSGLSPNNAFSILINPKDPTTLYAAAQLIPDSGQTVGIFKSTTGGLTWSPAAKGINQQPVSALVLAPTKPRKLYAFSGGRVFKSTNRSRKWKTGGFSSNLLTASLAVDPLTANTVYVATQLGVSKSTDGAATFVRTPLQGNIGLITVDPMDPSTVYAAGRPVTEGDRDFKSTDGGKSWNALGQIPGRLVVTLAIDPNNTSILYAGTFAGLFAAPNGDAFVARINPTGTALVFSTYLGGTGDDIARAIEVDTKGSAYLTGQTSSEDFPVNDGLQTRKSGGPTGYDVFVTKLDPSSALLFSTYLGGSANDDGRDLALDARGGVYIVGSTDSDDYPTVNPIQGTRVGAFVNGFVTKVVDPAAGGARFVSGKERR
jgi:hypothetical protein